MNRHAMCALSLGILQAMSAVASAQTFELEEIIVTAQKRVQSLQDVPISVSAISGEQINDIGMIDFGEVSEYIPNVTINKGITQPNLFIRGVGSGSNVGFEESVGLFIDGIYSGRSQLAAVPLTLDLERMEVLKGPQGILFGKNTVAGAISVTSARPSHEFESYLETQYAPADGEQVHTGVISGGLTDNLAARLAVRYEAMDGWWDNKTLNRDGPDRENLFARASLLWDVSNDVEALIKYERGHFDESDQPYVIYQSDQPVNFEGDSVFPVISDRDQGAMDIPSLDSTDVEVLGLTVNWDLSFATFTSVTGYATYDTTHQLDSDVSATRALRRELAEDYKQYSQEVRLVSPGGEDFDWILGAYYQTSDLHSDNLNVDLDFALLGELGLPALVYQGPQSKPATFDQASTSWSVFTQGTWVITDSLRATLGLRYNEESKDVDKVSPITDGLGSRVATSGPLADFIVYADPSSGALISDLRSHSFTGLTKSESSTTWAANLQWDVTNDAMLYASVSTGFKGGGYDEGYNSAGPQLRTGNILTGEPDGGIIETGIDSSILEFNKESALAYELGAKITLADGAANINMAIFLTEYEDLQVSSLVGDVYRVGNAGESTVQGAEIDGRWRLTEGFTLGGALAYLDASYDTFLGASCTNPQATDPVNNPGCLRNDGTNISLGERGGQDLSGETLTNAPEWTANINAEWVFPLAGSMELRTRIDANYSDEFYSSIALDPNTKHDAVTRINARIGLTEASETWSVALIGKNLTDKVTSVSNNHTPITSTDTYLSVPGRPRSVAIQARYRF